VTRLLVALGAVMLLLAGPAGAKRFTKLIVVGDRGGSIELAGSDLDPSHLSLRDDVRPFGAFLLVYPLFDRGIPGRPGRYFPAAHVACFSWNRSVPGACGRVSRAAALRLARAGRLARFRETPTILDDLELAGVKRKLESNGAVAIELAFNRKSGWRTTARPSPCKRATAVWAGPAAAKRPRTFCVAGRGLWSAGRLYPLQRLDQLLPEAMPTIAPPPATLETPSGTVKLAQGSYCWSSPGRGLCVDVIPPSARSDIPSVAVSTGDRVAFRLGFDPTEVSATLLRPDPDRSFELAPARVVEWSIPSGWQAPSGPTFVALFARGALGDTTYLARLVPKPD
jgi:hypothetical protein